MDPLYTVILSLLGSSVVAALISHASSSARQEKEAYEKALGTAASSLAEILHNIRQAYGIASVGSKYDVIAADVDRLVSFHESARRATYDLAAAGLLLKVSNPELSEATDAVRASAKIALDSYIMIGKDGDPHTGSQKFPLHLKNKKAAQQFPEIESSFNQLQELVRDFEAAAVRHRTASSWADLTPAWVAVFIAAGLLLLFFGPSLIEKSWEYSVQSERVIWVDPEGREILVTPIPEDN